MRILITGATGFVGGHLAEALADRGEHALHGLSRGATWPPGAEHLAGKVNLHAADLSDRDAVTQVLTRTEPDWIFHLAGYAHAGRSFQEPDRAWAGNLEATRNLYEGVVRWGGTPRILYVSSGLIYGDAAPAGGRCDESLPLRPASPYAASKAAADLASFQYARHPGLDIVVARPFNHTGPRQPADYAIPRFASQLAAIERGTQPPILETGDLGAWRDLTDVRDMVRAYILLLEKGHFGEVYNAGGGTAYRIRDVLDRLLALAAVRVEVTSRDTRPPESAVLRADADKLRRDTGWRPTITLDETLRDTLAYWRGRV